MPMLFLTEKDRDVLRWMRDKMESSRENIPGRPGAERAWAEGEDHQAPETYIAWPPEIGINGLVRDVADDTGTGVHDEPGFAFCVIYKIVEGELVAVSGFDKAVWNLAEGTIEQDWVVVTRTKYGKWVAVQAGAPTVRRGKLDEALFPDGTAQVSVWQFIPDLTGTGTPGEDVDTGESILAYDWLLPDFITGTGTPNDFIPANTKVIVTWFPTDRRWYVTGAQC